MGKKKIFESCGELPEEVLKKSLKGEPVIDKFALRTLSLEEIPAAINGINIEFKHTVNKNVDGSLIAGLIHCLKPDVAPGFTLHIAFVSSAHDGHNLPSRHAMAKAVDISRINGKRIGEFYEKDDEVTAIVKALQESFESFPERRENFGPHFCKKLGQPNPIPGHDDHVHFSVS